MQDPSPVCEFLRSDNVPTMCFATGVGFVTVALPGMEPQPFTFCPDHQADLERGLTSAGLRIVQRATLGGE